SAGLPVEVCGTTLDRMCGAGQQAANFAAMGVMAGQYDVVIAGGIEHMTRVPMGSNAMGPGDGPLSPKLQERFNIVPQGISAEMIAEKWGLKREELDEFSAQSHEKAGRAIAEGRFKREIVPVTLPDGSVFDTDEGVRVPVNREKIAALAPSFKPDGVVTAANSSQISDGAAALMFMSPERAKALGVRPRARVVATALAALWAPDHVHWLRPGDRHRHRADLGACRSFEERHGFAGVLRALGGLGGHVGAPHFLDQGVLDRGVEVAGTDRLEEAATDLEGVETVLVLFAQPPTGNEQDRHVRVHRAEPLGELPAIHAGHAEVRQHRVEVAGRVGGEGGSPARRGDDS